MNNEAIDLLRHHSRKLIRELGMLQINKADAKEVPSYWHTLIEIDKEADLTISKLSHLLLISVPTLSRIVSALIKDKLVTVKEGLDKRERFLSISKKGKEKIRHIDEFSNTKIKRAFHFLSQEDKDHLLNAISKYAAALEQSRILLDQIKILRITTSRTLRKQIINMIERIQLDEYKLPVKPEHNAPILRAEEEYYYHQTYNFWYAVDKNGTIIGSIGLKKLNNDQGEIKKFFVSQEYRGLGLAQKLIYTLANNAVKHGFSELFLGTVDKLQAAKRFYEKMGFAKINKKSLPKQFGVNPVDTCFYKVSSKELERILVDII